MTFFRAALLAALFLTVQPLAAQEQPADGQSIQAQETLWQVTCTAAAEDGALDCNMVKNLILAQSGQILAQATVLPGELPRLRLLAPHGLQISEGLRVGVDGEEVGTATFVTSLADGMVAELSLTPQIEGKLRFGEVMTVSGVQVGGGAFNFGMDLTGFATAIAKLR